MSRITNHPILGETPERKLVKFTYDGKTLEGYEGEPIASALRVAGVMAHRYTAKKHEPRGVFCAIGRCTDCVMGSRWQTKCQNLYHSFGRRDDSRDTVWCIQ